MILLSTYQIVLTHRTDRLSLIALVPYITKVLSRIDSPLARNGNEVLSNSIDFCGGLEIPGQSKDAGYYFPRLAHITRYE
jgi:hypothetical protein